MKRLLLVLVVASACGPRTAGGVLIGGAAGAGMGAGLGDDSDRGKSAAVGAAIGAGFGLIVGGILDLSSEDYWACPDNEPRCLD